MSAQPRTVRWVLLLSLALNVALVTALALPRLMPSHYGHAAAHQQHHRADRVPSPWALRRVLGEERRDAIEGAFVEHRPGIHRSIRAVREARREVRAAMQAEPFDAAALDRAFASLRARDTEAAETVQAMLTEVMAELTPEERARVAALMPEHRGWRGRRDRDRDR